MHIQKLQWLCLTVFFCAVLPSVHLNGQAIETLYTPSADRTGLGSLLHLAFDPDGSGLGYAVGNCGGFSRSTDNGESWQNADWEEGIDLEQVIVFPESGGQKVMAFTEFNYYISLDKGDKWEEGTFQLTPEEGQITDVFALGKNTAIFATSMGRIYRTVDNGQSWSLNELQAGMLETQCLDFNDGQNGWLGSLDGVLYRTSDGGQNWSILAQDTFAYYSLDLLNDTIGFCFTSAGIFQIDGNSLGKNLLSTGSQSLIEAKVTAGSEKTFIYTTYETIIKITIEDNPELLSAWPVLGYQHFTGRRLCRNNEFLWVAGQNKIVLAFQPGDSFDQFYASEPEIADFIKDVFFLSEEECLASSSVNNLFRIDKKQNDWKEVNLFRSFSSRYNTVLSNGTLALVDGLGLFILNDREFQFRSNLPNFDVLGLKSDPFNDSTLYLLTNWRLGGTELFKSTNNGLDWQSIYQSTFRASDVIIPAKDVLYVYSGSGSFDMDQSTDGGQTWKVIFSNEAIWIRSINFFDGDYGVMSLYDQIIITEDGGLNFKTYPQDFVENILFQSKRLLWATRFDGKGTHILKSKDGGQTWEDTFFLCDKVLRAKLDPFTGDIWYICTLGSVYVLRNEVSGFFHTPSATASFEIFPNPSNGLVNISFPRNQAIPADQLEIYDTAGRLIKKYDLDNYPLNSFDWSYLHSGAYIVRLIGEDFSESKKLLLHPQGSD